MRAEENAPAEEGNSLGIKGIIFDCDGVILDSRSANIGLYNYLLGILGKPVLNLAQEDYVHMATFEQSLDFIFTAEERAQVMPLLRKDDWLEEYHSRLRVEDALVPLLDWLRWRGVRLGICTNRVGEMTDFFGMFGLEGYFDPIVTASDVPPKPDPSGLLRVLEIWGFAPDDVAYIGDAQVDEQAAQASGIPFWSFKNPKLGAMIHISSFAELHDWLKAIS